MVHVRATISNMADAKLALIRAHLRDANGTNKITKGDAIEAAILASDPVECVAEFEPRPSPKKK